MADHRDDSSLTDTDRVSLWLMSADGRKVLARTLRNLKLPSTFDADLIVQVCHNADQMTAKGIPIASIPAWTTKTLRLRGIDLVRSPRSSGVAMARQSDDGDVNLDRAANVDVASEAEVRLDAEAVRQRLGAVWSTDDHWKVSAALTVLTVLYDEASPGAECPQPVNGASDVESAHWVGLWYAGRRDLFAGSEAQAANTLTKQRSRASLKVRELLRSSVTSGEAGESRG